MRRLVVRLRKGERNEPKMMGNWIQPGFNRLCVLGDCLRKDFAGSGISAAIRLPSARSSLLKSSPFHRAASILLYNSLRQDSASFEPL